MYYGRSISNTTPEGVQGVVCGEWGYGGRNVRFGVREHAMGAITADHFFQAAKELLRKG